jgi:hypothetical protein
MWLQPLAVWHSLTLSDLKVLHAMTIWTIWTIGVLRVKEGQIVVHGNFLFQLQ